MVYNVAYLSGQWAITLPFTSQQRYHLWDEGVRNIKERIETINNDDNTDAARVPLYKAWLVMVESFVRRWTEAFLPPDIKHAVNSVENGIGVQRTVWVDPPDNHLVQAVVIVGNGGNN